MAVDASLRNQGIGRRAVIDTLEVLRREYPGLRYLMFEVHRPPENGDPERRALDSRLIEFYRRLGAFFEDKPDDPRWFSLQNMDGMTIVAPPEIDGA